MLISIYLFINRYTINHKFLTIKKFIIIIFENMYLFLISKKLIYKYKIYKINLYIVTFLMISLLYYNNDYIYNNNDIMISSYLINALYNLLFIYFFYYLC